MDVARCMFTMSTEVFQLVSGFFLTQRIDPHVVLNQGVHLGEGEIRASYNAMLGMLFLLA